MLRAIRAAIGALVLALPLPGLASSCLWFAGQDRLLHVASGQVAADVPLPSVGIQAIAMDAQDCGVWVLGDKTLSRYDASGTLRTQLLPGTIDPRLGRATQLAVDPAGDALWLAGPQAIARVSSAGRLLAIAAVDAPLRALAAASEQGAWVLAHKQLVSHDAAGARRTAADLKGTAAGEPRQMAIDPIAGAAWIATNKELLRLPLAGTQPARVLRASEAIAAIAVNPLAGTLWLAEGPTLRELDPSGAQVRTVPLAVPGVQNVESLAVDAAARELWVGTRSGIARLSMEGALLAFIPLAHAEGLVAAQPLTLRPALDLLAPPDGALTNDARRTITLRYRAECNGQPCDPGAAWFAALQLQATLNGTAVGGAFDFDGTTREASYSPPQPLPEGANRLSAQLRDAAGNLSNTVLAQFTVDTLAPAQPAASAITVSPPLAGAVTVTGTAAVEAGSIVTVTNLRTGASVVTTATADGGFSAQIAAAAGDALTIAVTDAAGNAGAAASLAVPGGLPPDPSTVATAIDPTVPTRVGASTAFLYTGANPIQQGVASGTIEPRRAAVLRGRVVTREGQALPGVKVTVKDHPAFGHTFSREDGMFDMVVNGGGRITVQYDKSGLLPVQRTVDTPWGDWVRVPDAALIALDARATRIDLASGVAQAARSSVFTDANGSRQVTMLFAAGTTASLLMPDGTSTPATSLTVRASEYTVGPGGESAMPGPLPPTTDYTYAVELSADEAIAAGAKSVVFSQSVAVYVDNFLGFPVGTTVPSGYYDREKAAWIGSDNGRVVRVMSVEAGLAVLDVNGQGLPATDAHLARLGITEAERAQMASLFAEGKVLWRVPVRHFTPYDFNWLRRRLARPSGCRLGECVDQEVKYDPETCEAAGCVIETQNQVLGEALALTGTPYSLRYRSSRVPGYKRGSWLRIPLSPEALPDGLLSIRMEVHLAGQVFSQTFEPSANLTHRHFWDGKDAYGRSLVGRHPATVRIGYAFRSPWLVSSESLDSTAPRNPIWGAAGGLEVTSTSEVVAWASFEAMVDAPVPGASQHMGGWGIDANHVYDTDRGLLLKGDGRVRDTPVMAIDSYTQPGVGSWIVVPDLAMEADGSVLVAGGFGSTAATGGLRRISRTGQVTSVTGTATARSVAHRPGGDVFITGAIGAGGRDAIFRVNADGTLQAIAGSPANALPTDPADAAIRQLIYPRRIAADREGNVYFTQQVKRQGTSLVADCRVRRVNLSGTISDIAGNGSCFNFSGDDGPALLAGMQQPDDLALDDAGNVYFTDGLVVRKVTVDGRISTVAGMRSAGDASDGRAATETWLGVANTPGQQPAVMGVQALNVDRAGDLLISTWNRVLRLGKDGILRTVLGSTATACPQATAPGSAAVGACYRGLGAVTQDPQGRVFVMENTSPGEFTLRKVDPALPQAVQGEVFVPSDDGTLVHVFDANGRHMRDQDAKLGTTLLDFSYDAQGRLLALRDGDGNETRIERTASGAASAIVSPYGQRSTVAFDANGYLERLTDPAGQSHTMAYTASGLMTRFTRPTGASNAFTYSDTGLLLQDRDAAGGGWNMGRDALTGEVAMTSVEVRSTTYRNLGGVERIVRAPDGIETRSFQFHSGDDLLLKPNGTRVFTEHGPDPRFGLQVPVEKRTVVTMPSGLVFTQTATRSATTAAGLLNLATQTDTVTVNGKTWTTLFDAPTRMQTSTSPLGRRSMVKVDEKARPVQSSMSGVEPVNYSYDVRGRIAGISQGVRNTTMGYDALGRLGTVTDALGRSTGYAYDAAGRVTRKTLPDGRVIGFGYDANGNLTAITPPSRPVHAFTYTPVDLQDRYDPPTVPGVAMSATRYTYDRDKLLTSVIRPDGLVIDLNRDVAGRVSSVSTPTGTTTFTYSATTGELTDIAAPGGIALSYAYDGDLLLSETWSGEVSGSVLRTYDSHFDLQSLDVLGTRYSFTYDNDRLLTGVGAMTIGRDAANGFIRSTQLEGLATSQSYNAFGELQSHSATHGGTTLFAQSLAYDNAGRIVGKTEQVNGQTDSFGYGYDLAGRLETVSKNGSQITRYEYDPNGNRTSDGVNTAIYDAQDRLIQYGAATYEYTANGELKTKRVGSEVTQYEYDVLGNLRKVVMPDGKVIEYLIDGRNRRIGRKVNGVLDYGLIYLNQLNPVAQVDGQGNVIARFIYGTKDHVPDFMEKGGKTYRFVTDHLGSVRAVVDVVTGETVQRIEYDPFGVRVHSTGQEIQPFGFAGGLYDSDTGLDRFGARDYSAALGRWTTKDPISFGGGDTNLFGYVESNPLMAVDPVGLERKIVNLGQGWTGGIDMIPSSPGQFEIHVYDKSGKEVGMYGPAGWFDKHGHKGRPQHCPSRVENQLKGQAIDILRRAGSMPAKGDMNIKGDRWISERPTGGFGGGGGAGGGGLRPLNPFKIPYL